MDNQTYKIRVKRGDVEVEVAGDREFVLEMLKKYGKDVVPQELSDRKKVHEEKENKDTKAKSLSPGEFIRKTGFKKEIDIVLAFGYYLEKHSALHSFAPSDVNTCYYEAKMEASNTSQYFIELIRKTRLMADRQKGKKGKKKYMLTSTGTTYIENKLSQNGNDK